MIKGQKKTYLLLIFLCLVSVIQARTYSFRGITTTEGLQDLVVNALYKDSAGYVWMGTRNSLERFDGIRIKHYNIPGANEKIKQVNTILATSKNEIWMGNGMGLWRINHHSDILTAVAPEEINCGVRSLCYDGKSTLLIGTEEGLFLSNNGIIERILVESNVLSSANIINSICLDGDSIAWLATANGLYSLHISSRAIKHHHSSNPTISTTNNYNQIVLIRQSIYLGTMNQGIVQFDTKNSTFKPYISVACNVISSLSTDGNDILHVATDGNGVHFISTRTNSVVRSFRHEANRDGGLRSNSVYSLLVDRDGLIWIGFYQLGVDYTMYQSDLFSTYSYPPYFDSKDIPVRSIIIGNNDKLIGSRDGLYYINEEKSIFRSYKSPQLRSNLILCSHAFNEQYYVGTYGGGMYVFNPLTVTLSDFDAQDSQPFLKGHIFCITSDSNHNLWIGTSSGLYCYKDGKRIRHLTSSNSQLPDGNVYEVFFDSTGKGWICTENGLALWDSSSATLKTNVFPEGFIQKEKVRVIFEDTKHNLFLFPDKGKMFSTNLSMNRFRRSQPNLLEGKDGMFIIEDREGWFWIGTNDGLYRYDKDDIIIPYDFTDGIPSPIFTNCRPVIDLHGRLWLGNSKGLIYADVSHEKTSKKYQYPVSITDVVVNGKHSVTPLPKKNSVHSSIQLTAQQRNITICFSGFTFTDPHYMAYEYRMKGIDSEWQSLSGRSDVTYYNLHPGKHTFQIRRTGHPNSEVILHISISLSASFWVLITVLIIIAVLLYLYRQKIKSLFSAIGNIWSNDKPTPTTITTEDILTLEPEEIHLSTEKKYKSFKVSPEECALLEQKLKRVMQEQKPYTNPNLKLADLAIMMSTSPYTLSYFFSQYLNCTYYDYLNDYRIIEFKQLVNSDLSERFTLNALAEMCGFSSRASFFRYFKKVTGIAPKEYIRSIGKQEK